MRVQASLVIRRPRETTFDCVTSMAFLQQWIAPFRVEKYDIPAESHYREVHHTLRFPELHQVTEGALGVGTRFTQSNESRGHPLEATIEVTEYERPSVFAVKVTAEIGTSQTKWVFQPASEGTRVTFMFRSKARGWRMKLVTLIAFLTTKNVGTGSPQYMQELKNYLEEQCES